MPYKDPEKRKEYDRKKYHQLKSSERYHRLKTSSEFLKQQAGFGRNYRLELKIKVLSHYGSGGRLQCSWPGCFIDDIDMLQLDHVHNGGSDDRRAGLKSNRIYSSLIQQNYPEGYQTLCANHNWKKEILRRRVL